MPTLTRTLLKNATLPQGQKKLRIYDDRLIGFFAEIRRSCTTFYVTYRDARGRHPEIRLGRLGDVTVDQARARAQQLKAEISLGGDPAAEKRRELAVPLLGDFVRDRYLTHARERLRSHKNTATYCRRILAYFGRKALNEVTVTDVADFRRWLIKQGLAAGTVNRHLATLRAMFNMARRWGLYDGPNPAASPGMLPELHRDRYLSAEETQALMAALDLEPCRAAAAAIALLALTGARKQEVLGARWQDVDLARCILTVPRAKNGRTRHIPLSPPAVRVLALQAQRREPDNGHVFPGKRPGRPLESVRGPWERAKRRAGLLPDTRLHDLRHSFASALANAGTPLNEIGVVLGHTQLSTTARYAHHAPQRLIETASIAAKAWRLLPAAE